MKAPAFWDHTTHPLALLLSPFGWLYGASVALRRAVTRPCVSDIPVICVGNLTAGGSGKTPAVLLLARMLYDKGVQTFALTRGYGGHLTGPLQVQPDRHTAGLVGDEALLLARHMPVWVAKNRAAGAAAINTAWASKDRGTPAVILMDDGFQNPTVQKDLSLLVVDGPYGFGNGHMVPAGPLREPVRQGMKHCDGILLLNATHPPTVDMTNRLQKPLYRGSITADPETIQRLQGKPVVAFCGIARPERFKNVLEQHNIPVAYWFPFADHHPFTDNDLHLITETAAANGLPLVTTEKDYVRLSPVTRQSITPLPITIGLDTPHRTALLEQIMIMLQSRSW